MKNLIANYSKINTFSQRILKIYILAATLLFMAGAYFINHYDSFHQLFIARKTVETAFCLYVIGFALACYTDYIIKKRS